MPQARSLPTPVGGPPRCRDIANIMNNIRTDNFPAVDTAPWFAALSRPARLLSLLCLAQVAIWTVVPALVDRTPPNDSLEEFLWSREWMLLTYKHPQLPAWLTSITYHLTGSYIWGGYLLPQLAVCVTFALVYALGRDMMGPRAALAGVLLLPVTGFFSAGTRQFNHDIAQLPFWAGIAWLLWRAAREDKIGWWVLLGTVAGAGLYAKFSTGLLLLFGALWLFCEPTARRRMATPGPWIAMAIVIAFTIPLILGMERANFVQLTYVAGRDDWVLGHRGRLYYIGVQAALMLFFPVALWTSGLLSRGANEAAGASPALLEDRRARSYLLWMGLGPALLLCGASLFVGVGEAWGKPMYDLVGLVAVAYLGRRLTARAMRRLAVWGFGMVLLTAAFHAAYAGVTCTYGSKPVGLCLPGPEIAARLQSDWHRAVDAPLGIVAGSEFLMMDVGALATDRPSMFTDFSPAEAPWVTPERLHREGMLIVWGDGPPPAEWRKWTGDRPIGHESFVWNPRRPPLEVSYVVVPPGTQGAQP